MSAPRSLAYAVGSNPTSPKTNHQDCTEPDTVNGNRYGEAQGKEVSLLCSWRASRPQGIA